MGTRQAMGLRSFHYAMASTPGELSVALHWHLRSTPSSGAQSSLPPFLLLFFCPLANSAQECGNFIFGGASPSVQYYGIEHRAFQNQLFLHQSHLLHSFLQRFREGVPAQLSAGPCPVEITQVTVYLSFFGSWISFVFFFNSPKFETSDLQPCTSISHAMNTVSYVIAALGFNSIPSVCGL